MKLVDFDLYKDVLHEKAGMVITPDLSYLLDSRLGPVARKWNYDLVDALAGALRGMPEAPLVNDIIEAMTDNETAFFYDRKAFGIFQNNILPALLKSAPPGKPLKIWCAAAASGQEPYSLALLLHEKKNSAGMAGRRLSLLATDISGKIIEKAASGLYSQPEVQRGLPIQILIKHFRQKHDEWQVSSDVRKLVNFQQFNLLGDMTGLGGFHVIVCRNVLGGFEEHAAQDILARMADQLEPGGFLLTDAHEAIHVPAAIFKPVPGAPGLYTPA